MVKIGSAFFILNFLFSWAFAEGVKVEAIVESNQVAIGEVFQLTISVVTSESAGVGEPRLPDLAEFNFHGRTSSVQAQSTFTNGQFVFIRTQNYHYSLSALKEGQFKIGSAAVNVGGKTYQTQPITISVAKGAGQIQRKQQPNQVDPQNDPFNDPFFDEADDVFSQLLKRRGGGGGGGRGSPQNNQPINPDEAFFLQVEVDKDKVYAGEQITASWFIYTRNLIRDIDTLAYPSLKGFWKEDIYLATNLNFTNEIINGIPYRKALLASYALFPISEGSLTIDPYKAKCTVIMQGGMGGFGGFGKPYEITKSSRPIKIQVLPLPKDGQPPNFSGAVGSFSMGATVQSQTVPMGEPFTFKIRVEGSGNAKVIELPPIELPSNLDQFDLKKDSKFFKNGKSFKDFEFLLVPREVGNIVLPSVTFSYFDPEQNKYISRSSPALNLNVVPGKAGENVKNQRMDLMPKVEVPQVLPDLMYNLGKKSSWKPIRYYVWSVVFLIIVGFILYRIKVEILNQSKSKTLVMLLQDRFNKTPKISDQESWRLSATHIINLVYFVLGEMSEKGKTNDSLSQLIDGTPPSVKREIEKPLKEVMQYFEALAFAPEEFAKIHRNNEKLQENIKNVKNILTRAISIFEKL